MPLITGQGSSKYYGDGARSSEAILGLFHGMQPNAAGHRYPMASDMRYRMDGSAAGAVDLAWPELVATHQADLVSAQVEADPLQFDLELSSFEQLSAFTADPLVLIHGQRCLLTRLPVKLTMQAGALLARGCRAIKLLNP